MNINYFRSQIARADGSMKIQRISPSSAYMFFALLSIIILFQGCATMKTLTVQGAITTPENRSFSLSSKDQKLLIKPGNMNVELIEHGRNFGLFAVTSSSLLQLETDQGQIITTYPPEWKFRVFNSFVGKLAGNKIHIVGVTQDMSADIDVSWSDQSEEVNNTNKIESCSYEDSCWESYTVTTCDKDGKNCYSQTEWGYVTCWKWGYQKVIITTEKYKRSYKLDFLNPQNIAELYGHFEGQSDSLYRNLAKEIISPCQ